MKFRSASETRRLARESLEGHYWQIFLACLISSLIVGATTFASLLLSGPLAIGLATIILRMIRLRKSDDISLLFSGFNDFSRSLVMGLLYALKIFLWSLLFIIPGIVRSYSLAMSSHIAFDRPELSASEILVASTNMMRGHRWRLFCLNLSFIGWFILSIFTLGIGFFFLIPYMQTSTAIFYEELRESQSPQMVEN
jgi:uncharacterized membrane protein